MKNMVKLFGIIVLAALIGFSFVACGNGTTDGGGGGGGGGGGLTADIDPALRNTSWKDNINGTTWTVSFSSSSITWGGTAASSLNTATSAYQGSGYDFAWVANNGNISYKYRYNGGSTATVPVYQYVKNGSATLELKASGMTFVTLVPNS